MLWKQCGRLNPELRDEIRRIRPGRRAAPSDEAFGVAGRSYCGSQRVLSSTDSVGFYLGEIGWLLTSDLTMNERSFILPIFMSQPQIDSSNADRRSQILDAALVCFAKRGFHQTSMHDISGEAGISVGLIYRYFENKEAVISAMAARHKQEIQQMLERARQAPSLLESLEILFTAHCCENEPRLISAFVVDLYAEASRNPHVADLVRDVLETAMNGVRDLIARAPEAQNTGNNLTPADLAELIFAVARGMLMLDVLRPHELTAADRRTRQLEVTRTLWRLLFKPEAELVYA